MFRTLVIKNLHQLGIIHFVGNVHDEYLLFHPESNLFQPVNINCL